MVDKIAEKIARERYQKVRIRYCFFEKGGDRRGERGEKEGEERGSTPAVAHRGGGKGAQKQLAAFFLRPLSAKREPSHGKHRG